MSNKKPKLFTHGCYIGTTGFNNHTRDFFRELSKNYEIKVRNFTVGKHWKGLEDEPFNKEEYLTSSDKILLEQQTYFNNEHELNDFPIYQKYSNNFDHDLNIVLAEVNHHYFYQNYEGPKIGYTVWETTRYPDYFLNKLKEYDQLWVPSEWQKQCNIEQGIPEDKIKIIPEAVDAKTFHPNPEANLPEYDDGRFKFIHFGRWDYRKSTKEIIESFLEEFGVDEPVDLILSIDNNFAKDKLETTENRLKNYNLEDPRLKIKHFPSREDYIQYLQKGHVFLSCARAEGWNLPLIEAMACGTPSIYSNCSAQLQFAKGKGLPVKITGKKPAIMGEYSTFSQSDMTGEFYTPDYEDLKRVMRDAYKNYDKHKKQALKESKEIRDKFTWKKAAELASVEIDELYNNLPKNIIEISFDEGPKVEIKGHRKNKYFVEFIDSSTNQVIHSDTISNNMWTKCSKKYYIPWIIKINEKIVHKFDLTNKDVKLSFESNSVGDTLAWAPQILEFQKKHNCKVTVSTFHNEWFKNLEAYKNINFIQPNIPFEAYAHYKIGWFKTDGKWDSGSRNPNQPNTVPLIQAATDILGLPYKEINKGVDFTPGKRPIKGKYICIGPRATAGLKEWPYSNWRELANKLHKKGYKIVNLSYEGFTGTNIIDKQKLNWEKTFNYLYHSDLFIGLGSGLSWVNWALNKRTVMINNFIPFGYEFTNKLIKIENNSVCNNCWVNKDYIFDPGDWNWCPKNKGTKDQHICQKSITVDQVYNKVLNLLNE
jgi:autotransporter strand-loop-strand O-heptosyltransferase